MNNIKNIIKNTLLVSSLVLASNVLADEIEDLKKISAFKDSEISKSPIDNLFYISKGGKTLLTDKTGKFVIDGEVFERKDNALISLKAKNERALKAPFMQQLISHQKDFAFFPSKWINEKGEADKRATVYVFSDITCPYCKHFHNDLDKFQRSGIEVYYVPFPRKGLEDIGTVRGLQKILCSANKAEEYNKAFFNPQSYIQNVTSKDIACNESYDLLSLYELGDKLGVIGTPAIFTSKGSAMFGYQDPMDFARSLKQRLNDEHFDEEK